MSVITDQDLKTAIAHLIEQDPSNAFNVYEVEEEDGNKCAVIVVRESGMTAKLREAVKVAYAEMMYGATIENLLSTSPVGEG